MKMGARKNPLISLCRGLYSVKGVMNMTDDNAAFRNSTVAKEQVTYGLR